MITAISTDWGINPRIVRITTTDDLGDITSPGYINSQQTSIQEVNNGVFEFLPGDLFAIYYNGGEGFFTYNSVTDTFIPNGSGGEVLAIVGTDNQINIDSTDPQIPIVSIAPNAILPGTEGVTIPSGSTAQRPVSPLFGELRGNINFGDLEFWNGDQWLPLSTGVAVNTIVGTANQIDVNDEDPTAPVISLAANAILPGNAGFTPPSGTTAQRPGSPIPGQDRYNTDILSREYWDGTEWVPWAFNEGSGNVIAPGDNTTGQIAMFTSDGYHIGASSLFDAGYAVFTPEIFQAQKLVAQGSNGVLAAGTIQVTNGNPFVFGTGTQFTQIFTSGSAIVISGVPYVIQSIYTDTLLQLTLDYAGADASGLTFNNDDNYIATVTTAGAVTFLVSSNGSLLFPNVHYQQYLPTIAPVTIGGANSSSMGMSSDSIVNNIWSSGNYNLNNESGLIFNINGAGNGLLAGDLTLGYGATTGQTLHMPTNNYDTYTPTIVSSNTGLGGFSVLTYNADSYVFNMASGQGAQFNGALATLNNTLDDGAGNLTITGDNATFNANAATSNFAFVVKNNSSIGDYALRVGTDANSMTTIGIDFLVAGTPAMGYPGYFHIQANPTSPNPGQIDTLFNTLDDGSGNLLASTLNARNATSYAYKILVSGNSFDNTSDTGGAAIVLNHNASGNRQIAFTDSDNLLVPGDSSHAMLRFVLETDYLDISGVATDGTTSVPLNIQAGGAYTQFGGYVSIGSSFPGYKLTVFDNDAAIYIANNSGIPFLPTGGVVLFTNYDSGLGYSLLYAIDDAGNVYQLGAGSGGSGTVTLVETTSDLTVNGTPGGSFSVDGTIGLANTAVTAGSYQFGGFTVDAKGRLTAANSMGYFNNTDGNLWLNGTGTSGHTSLLDVTIVGDGADVSNDSVVGATIMGAGASASNGGTSIGYLAGSASNGHLDALFIGNSADATSNNFTNVMALGSNTRVSQDNSFVYGDNNVFHGMGTRQPLSRLHLVNGTSDGTSNIFRRNGIYSPGNVFSVTDIVTQHQGVVTDGVQQLVVLSVPISNGLNGCMSAATFYVSGIVGDGVTGTSAAFGTVTCYAHWDGTNYWLNGVIAGPPIPITLQFSGTSLMYTASAQVALTGGGGIQDMQLEVTGINGYHVVWTAWCDYTTTQSNVS